MSENMIAQELRNQIRQAFPATQFCGPITPCECEECMDIREGLRHKQWDQIPAAFIELTCNLTLLTPEAFQAFLPAYLLRALDDLSGDGIVVHLAVHCLCPNKNPDDGKAVHIAHERLLLQRAGLMSPAQIQAIRSFLQFVEKNAGHREWFQPYISRALETVWR